MAHVVMGTKILRQGGIPEPVVEFAYTHHGTQVVEYFWHKCKEGGNPKGLTQEHFRYPGMKPQTKETAILMLVDSIEAASRTIFPPEQKKFEEMIQRVIFTKLSSGQLDESGLTLEDLRIITARMASTLVNMYHGRIKYPWQREADRAAASLAKTGETPAPPSTLGETPRPAAKVVETPTPPGAAEAASPTPRSPEAKAEAKTEPKAEAKTEPKAEAKTEPKAEAKTEPKAEAKTEPKAEAKAEPKPEPVRSHGA